MVVPEVDQNLLSELETMGFPKARAIRALHFSGEYFCKIFIIMIVSTSIQRWEKVTFAKKQIMHEFMWVILAERKNVYYEHEWARPALPLPPSPWRSEDGSFSLVVNVFLICGIISWSFILLVCSFCFPSTGIWQSDKIKPWNASD